MEIGILALQGAFAEHGAMLERLGAGHFEIRQRRDLARRMDGLILPGGESTAMKKLLKDLDLLEVLRGRIREGLPVFGTCAGLILLAERVEGGEVCFGTMHITAHRNAYGRQLESFYAEEEWKGIGRIPMAFIRAPEITGVGAGVEVLACVGERIVAVREGVQLVTAFHPELSEDESVHRFFLETVQSSLRRA